MNMEVSHVERSIISTALHQINVEDEECRKISIGEHADLEEYLSNLLDEIRKKEQKRSYEFARNITDLKTILESYYKNNQLQENENSNTLSKKLLDVEVETDRKYGHLGNSDNGHIKKGSFLQFIYKENEKIFYLGVKIEHQEFLDESDFKKKIGLSIANKVYKATQVIFDDKGKPASINIFDTNSTPAKYWWKDFLVLKVVRDDALNTSEASRHVINTIEKYKKNFPVDYTILRGSAIAAFKQEGVMNYDEFISNIFEKYTPDNPDFELALKELTKKLKDLPEKKKFDTQFNLVPSEVKFKKIKIKLTSQIDISYDEEMKNIENKIWSQKDNDEYKVVVKVDEEAYNRFNFKRKLR